MLLNIDPHCQKATQIAGRAHIVIAVLDDGKLHIQAFRQGVFNTSYLSCKDDILKEIPKVLAELREELVADDAQFSESGS